MSMTLVLIGRESPVRERLVANLRELPGVEVVVLAPGADDIRSTMLARDPEAVLIDIQQAQAGGLRLIRAIRGLRSGRSPVIIALSSSASIQYRTKCHEAGATFFFDTAGDQELLLGAVQSIGQEIDHHAGLNDSSKQERK
jgi:two-component system, NarL family, response regulator DevR